MSRLADTAALRDAQARGLADDLAPHVAAHLCAIARTGRFGVQSAATPYLLESVLADEKLIEKPYGAITPLGQRVAALMHNRSDVQSMMGGSL